jgi:hypothetical protein
LKKKIRIRDRSEEKDVATSIEEQKIDVSIEAQNFSFTEEPQSHKARGSSLIPSFLNNLR